MSKKMYNAPKVEIVEFGREDVVVCSFNINPDPDTTTDEQC